MSAPIHASTFHDRRVFERNLTRALWLAPLLGLAAEISRSALGLQGEPGSASIAAALLGLGLAVSIDAGDRLDRFLLCSLSMVPPVVWLLGSSGASRLWAFLFATAVLGVIPVRAQAFRTGVEGGVARARPSPWHDLAGAVGTALLGGLGLFVSGRLAEALRALGAPSLLQVAAFTSCIALFMGLGALAAHLWLVPDPLERRAESLAGALPKALVAPVQRALTAYRACGALLAGLPRHAVRDELALTIRQLTARLLDGAEAWQPHEVQGGLAARAALATDAASLLERASRSRDPVTQAHLERAATSLAEEATRLAGLELEREQELARLEADATLLDQARVALLVASSRSAQEGLFEVETLAARLRKLSSLQFIERAGSPSLLTSEPLDAHALAHDPAGGDCACDPEIDRVRPLDA